MSKIALLSSSIRQGRNSHRVALFLERLARQREGVTTDMIDLDVLDFPLFDERLKFQSNPVPALVDYAARIRAADGVIIVTPEYNGGYPASLKNAIDVLVDEWRRKPVAISTVSNGVFGGMQVITSLQFSLWKIKAWTVPAMFPVPKVQDAFAEDGTPTDPAATEKRANAFLDELSWCMEAARRMRA